MRPWASPLAQAERQVVSSMDSAKHVTMVSTATGWAALLEVQGWLGGSRPPNVHVAAHGKKLAERHGRQFCVCLITLDWTSGRQGAHR